LIVLDLFKIGFWANDNHGKGVTVGFCLAQICATQCFHRGISRTNPAFQMTSTATPEMLGSELWRKAGLSTSAAKFYQQSTVRKRR
jgi:hypothetical protein